MISTLKTIKEKDIELWVEDQQLRYRAPKNAMSKEIINQIKQNKSEIMRTVVLSETLSMDKALENYPKVKQAKVQKIDKENGGSRFKVYAEPAEGIENEYASLEAVLKKCIRIRMG